MKERKLTKQIKSQYYNPDLSASFTSTSGFLSNSKFKDKKAVEHELLKLREITLHKPLRKRFPRRKTIVHFTNFQYQADLIDMSKYASENDNNKWILTLIDCFSRYAYVFVLKDKSAESVVAAFKIFFKLNKGPIRLVQSDSGKEFKNRKLYDLFKQHKVKHFTSFTEVSNNR